MDTYYVAVLLEIKLGAKSDNSCMSMYPTWPVLKILQEESYVKKVVCGSRFF